MSEHGLDCTECDRLSEEVARLRERLESTASELERAIRDRDANRQLRVEHAQEIDRLKAARERDYQNGREAAAVDYEPISLDRQRLKAEVAQLRGKVDEYGREAADANDAMFKAERRERDALAEVARLRDDVKMLEEALHEDGVAALQAEIARLRGRLDAAVSTLINVRSILCSLPWKHGQPKQWRNIKRHVDTWFASEEVRGD